MQTRGIGLFKGVGSAFALALLISLIGCKQNEAAAADSAARTAADKSMPRMAKGAPEWGAALLDQAPLHTAARQPGAERSTVRQATLGVEVDNLEKAEKAMKESLALHGGYIDHEVGADLASEHPSMQLTIRVPEKSFEDTVTGFESLGHRTQKTIAASDITEQILDNEARLKQLQAEEATLKAGQAPSLNQEFDSTKDRIKELQNRKAELNGQAAMSLIELTLSQKPNASLSSAANSTWGTDTWNAAVSSAMGAFRVVGALAIWLLVYSPIWASIVFVSVGIHRLRKRIGTKSQVA